MTNHFTTTHIPGKGRGKFLGYPTINMKIPVDFDLPDGIYASWVTIGGVRYGGALHWGPIPTFKDTAKSLEVFVLGGDFKEKDISIISVEIVKKIREIMHFSSANTLVKQIDSDVRVIEQVLQTHKIHG